jgi:energy-coupling factor transporter ATP-binding protein EcfA2
MNTIQINIDNQILTIDTIICRHIDRLDSSGRGEISQDILAQLRNFIEHIMLKIFANKCDINDDYKNIQAAINFVKTRGQLKFLWKFHDFLQKVASHYTLDPENSERLMLKYYEYLLKIKDFLKNKYSLNVLANLDKFPLNTDNDLHEYYEKITAKLINRDITNDIDKSKDERYYIHKIKPFFVNHNVYYEVTFIPAIDRASKFERIIAFTKLDISKNYAVKLWVISDNIQIVNKTMPIFIIVNWEVSIRPCEIEKLAFIFGDKLNNYGGSAEYKGVMKFLTQTGFNMVELLCFEEDYYQKTSTQILIDCKANVSRLFKLINKCREIIKGNKPGCNVLRYLLYHLDNDIIKKQLDQSNNKLSDLRLSYGCIPFEKMPFCTSLLNHNPKYEDLIDCINPIERTHEIFAHFIHNNMEKNGQLYTHIKELAGFEDVDTLIKIFNSKLYYKHQLRSIEKCYDYFYIRGYEDDTIEIIKRLIELSRNGIKNYSSWVNDWLASGVYNIDCDEKITAIQQMFVTSSVALIYGSAGTGKSTLINHISNLFHMHSKLYLANTNPAIDNLKRRVNASNCEFMTITKFLNKKGINKRYDLLIIDECSTTNNRDMKDILSKTKFNLLVLVGDIYQIESIRFGNWFGAARKFISETSVCELTKPYRSNNQNLLELWHRVRNMNDNIIELITKQGYSTKLDVSIFSPAETDEIILCLNYDGLYGINNINRFLQEANQNHAVPWGLQIYKVGDPVLFNESERFTPVVYNNMKGRILAISLLENQIQFDIEIFKVINGLDAEQCGLILLDNPANGHSAIRFCVNKYKSTDEDVETSSSSVVPFQVAYAVSIHKAQGLEYNSVKIVITEEIEERITHNIFYTAITRAREKLKIYWTPEVEKKVLGNIKPRDIKRDVTLLKSKINTTITDHLNHQESNI